MGWFLPIKFGIILYPNRKGIIPKGQNITLVIFRQQFGIKPILSLAASEIIRTLNSWKPSNEISPLPWLENCSLHDLAFKILNFFWLHRRLYGQNHIIETRGLISASGLGHANYRQLIPFSQRFININSTRYTTYCVNYFQTHYPLTWNCESLINCERLGISRAGR
jgi:hypothetical protein